MKKVSLVIVAVICIMAMDSCSKWKTTEKGPVNRFIEDFELINKCTARDPKTIKDFLADYGWHTTDPYSEFNPPRNYVKYDNQFVYNLSLFFADDRVQSYRYMVSVYDNAMYQFQVSDARAFYAHLGAQYVLLESLTYDFDLGVNCNYTTTNDFDTFLDSSFLIPDSSNNYYFSGSWINNNGNAIYVIFDTDYYLLTVVGEFY